MTFILVIFEFFADIANISFHCTELNRKCYIIVLFTKPTKVSFPCQSIYILKSERYYDDDVSTEGTKKYKYIMMMMLVQ